MDARALSIARCPQNSVENQALDARAKISIKHGQFHALYCQISPSWWWPFKRLWQGEYADYSKFLVPCFVPELWKLEAAQICNSQHGRVKLQMRPLPFCIIPTRKRRSFGAPYLSDASPALMTCTPCFVPGVSAGSALALWVKCKSDAEAMVVEEPMPTAAPTASDSHFTQSVRPQTKKENNLWKIRTYAWAMAVKWQRSWRGGGRLCWRAWKQCRAMEIFKNYFFLWFSRPPWGPDMDLKVSWSKLDKSYQNLFFENLN